MNYLYASISTLVILFVISYKRYRDARRRKRLNQKVIYNRYKRSIGSEHEQLL